MTSLTSEFRHILSHHIAGEITIRFVVAAVNIVDNALKHSVNIANTTKVVLVVEMERLSVRPIQNRLLISF